MKSTFLIGGSAGVSVGYALQKSNSIFAEDKKDDIFKKRAEVAERVLNSVTPQQLAEIVGAYDRYKHEERMLAEKRRIIEILVGTEDPSPDNGTQVPSKDSNDKEGHLFEPIEPEPLTEDEKKLTAKERISNKFMGDIPPQVNDVIDYFSNHDDCVKNNISIDNRLLMYGAPGVGKSYLVEVLARELQVTSFLFNAPIFRDKYIGESSRKIRKAFDTAQKLNKPVFIFIDEVDGIATKRKDSTHDEQRATLITLMTELQKLQKNKNIFIFAATNDIKALDSAVTSRFPGSIIEMKPLTIAYREKLIKKAFKDHGAIIDDQFAHRLADVTGTKIKLDEGAIVDPQPEVKNGIIDFTGAANANKRTKNSYSYLYVFSNREIEHIVTTSLFKKHIDCKQNNKCNQHLCAYVRKTIDESGKPGNFADKQNTKYCEGI
jgi:SpoVK/Ycf46/Vps4 family AAA+-type ATPase